MVKYETIVGVMEEYLSKCTDYPKYQAERYVNENIDNFAEETWDEGVRTTGKTTSPPGHLFSEQEEAQKDVDYDYEETYMLKKYGRTHFKAFQAFRNGDTKRTLKHLKKLEKEENDAMVVEGGDRNNVNDWRIKVRNGNEVDWIPVSDAIDLVDSAVNKSPGLKQDTKLYGYARLPTDANGNPVGVGKTGTYKGLRGMSYNQNLVHNPDAFLQKNGWVNPDTRYNITYICLKGTKGVNLGRSVHCDNWQNERLMGSGQRCYVKEINEETKEAVVVVY